MKQGSVFVIVAAVVGVTGIARPMWAQTVGACPDPNNCVQVSLTPASQNVTPGSVFSVALNFKQAPTTGDVGGPDKTAAVALTIGMAPSGGGNPLALDNCTLTPDGLPGSVQPDPSISNFKVVVENVSCANGRTHCLCPDPLSGITPDNFINLVIYGPNPLPTPGPAPIDIPTLPAGPNQLLTISLRAAANASGNIPLHVYNQAQDASHPQFTALLSIGDKAAVDQTCVPVTGQPPCSTAGAVSQVATTDAAVAILSCAGDCDGSGAVDVTEIIKMVNIALGTASVDTCTAGDVDGNGSIDVTEIIQAVNKALNAC